MRLIKFYPALYLSLSTIMLYNFFIVFAKINTVCDGNICIFKYEDLIKDIAGSDKNDFTEILDIKYIESDRKPDSNQVNYLESYIGDRMSDTADSSLNDAGTIAAWLLIVIIVIPCLLVMSIFILCCQYVFNWCKPRHHIHREYAPPLLIQPQVYPRINPSSNFNA